MKFPNDNRVWFDSSREVTVYNAYDDQRFYSMEYTGPEPEKVLEFANKAREFSRWVREYMLAKQSSQEVPPMPSFVLEDSECETTESAPEEAPRAKRRKKQASAAGTNSDKQQDSQSTESSSSTNQTTE